MEMDTATLATAASERTGPVQNATWTNALFSVATVLVVMNTMMFNFAVPVVAKQFHLSPASVGWVVTGYSILFSITSITYSRLSDYLPIRTLQAIGIAFLGVGSIVGLFSHSFTLLLCARLAQALGASSAFSLALVYISRFMPVEVRGKSMSAIMASSSLGLGLGPVIGGAVVQYLGWNFLFVITGSVVFLLPLFLRRLPRETAKSVSFDVIGAVLIGISSTGLLLFVTNRYWEALAAGIVGIVLFALRIRRTRNPFIQPILFGDRAFLKLISLGVIPYMNSFAALFLLPQLLAHVYGLTPGQSGLIIFPGSLMSMVVSNRIGRIIDKYGNAGILRYGPWLLLVAEILFALFAVHSWVAVMVIYALLNISFSALSSSVSNEVSRVLRPELIGGGMGLLQLLMFFSGAFSVAVTSSALVWQHSIPLLHAYSNLFWGMAVIAALGVVASVAYLSGRKKEAQRSVNAA